MIKNDVNQWWAHANGIRIYINIDKHGDKMVFINHGLIQHMPMIRFLGLIHKWSNSQTRWYVHICAIFWGFFEHMVFYEDHVSTCGWLIRHWLAKCSKGINTCRSCANQDLAWAVMARSEQRQSVSCSWDDLYLKISIQSPSNLHPISIQSPVLIDFMIYFSRKATFKIWLHHAPSIPPPREMPWVSTPWREGLVSSVQWASFFWASHIFLENHRKMVVSWGLTNKMVILMGLILW